MRAVADGVPGDLHRVVEPRFQECLAEGLAAVGVGALSHHQHRQVLPERHGGVERRCRRLRSSLAGRHGAAAHPLDDPPEVLRRGAAAAADQRDAVLPCERVVGVGEFARRQRVAGARRGELGQPGVRHDRQPDAGRTRQRAQVLGHLGRTGRAIESDEVDPERLQRGERGRGLRTQQHRAGQLDGDLRDEDDVPPGSGHPAPRADERGLRLQQVLARLDEERVDAARDHRRALLGVGVAQKRVRCVAEARQLGAGADRPEHPPWTVGGRDLVGDPASHARAGLGELRDARLDAVLGEVGPVRAERVRLDRVDADVEVGPVDARDHVGPGGVEDLVAALVALEVVETEVGGLDHGAHGAVRDDHTLGQGGEEIRRRLRHERIVVAAAAQGRRGAAPRASGAPGVV